MNNNKELPIGLTPDNNAQTVIQFSDMFKRCYEVTKDAKRINDNIKLNERIIDKFNKDNLAAETTGTTKTGKPIKEQNGAPHETSWLREIGKNSMKNGKERLKETYYAKGYNAGANDVLDWLNEAISCGLVTVNTDYFPAYIQPAYSSPYKHETLPLIIV